MHFWLKADFVDELKIDQSVAHDGVCLTVVDFRDGLYCVTAIAETLERTNLASWKLGDKVNLERCLRLGDRLDGHMVQGHVDTVAVIDRIEDFEGSKKLYLKYQKEQGHVTVEKGSVCLNGISLTVVDSGEDAFSVAIIPYTWEHTNLCEKKPGDKLNVEFDILGKYIAKMMVK